MQRNESLNRCDGINNCVYCGHHYKKRQCLQRSNHKRNCTRWIYHRNICDNMYAVLWTMNYEYPCACIWEHSESWNVELMVTESKVKLSGSNETRLLMCLETWEGRLFGHNIYTSMFPLSFNICIFRNSAKESRKRHYRQHTHIRHSNNEQ